MKHIFKFFSKMAICMALVCPVAVSCYDDSALRQEIEDIKNQLMDLEEKMNAEIKALNELINGSVLVTEVSTDENNLTTIKFSDGTTIQLYDKGNLKSNVTYITTAGVDYWAYIDETGKRKFFLNENGERIPVASETPEVITIDGDTYIVIGGVQYPLSGNSVFSDYELVKNELTDEVYAVTFTFGEDMSFTVAVDGAASFLFVQNEGWSQVAISDYFVPAGLTSSVQYQAYGVVDFIVQAPDGWKWAKYEDPFMGNGFNITAPAAELIESGAAAGKGDFKVMAVLEGGKAMMATLEVTTAPFKVFSGSFGKANIKKNNGLQKYVYGLCEESQFDEDAVYAKALEVIDMYDYPAGYGVEFYDLVDYPLADIAQTSVTPGAKYVLWALPAFYDMVEETYFMKEGTFVKEIVRNVELTMEIVNEFARDAIIDIEIKGVESYYFGVTPKEVYFAEDVANLLNYGYYTPVDELEYNGSVFELAGEISSPATEYVAWLAVAEEGKTYAAKDLAVCEFETRELTPGSAVKVVAEVEASAFDIEASLTAEGGEMIYYTFLASAAAAKYEDDAARAAYLFEKGVYAPVGMDVVARASDFISNMKPKMNLVLFALATDSEGKYSEVLVQVCSTTELQYNDIVITVENILNSPEQMELKISATGGEVVEYLYWLGMTSDNFWKSPNVLGGKLSSAQEYMYLNSTKSTFANIAEKYPIVDGVITMTDHMAGFQYVLVIMAKDASGMYSKATELKFTPYSVNIGDVVLKNDPKWEEAEPEIEWIVDRFTPQIGMMPGAYGFNITLPVNYTAYVLTGTDAYFVIGDEAAEPLSVEEKILAVIEFTDDARDSERVVDVDLYNEKGYPYGHEFYHYEHGDPMFGSAVLWANREAHENVCDCVEKDVEKDYHGIPYIQKHVLTFNTGEPVEFAQYQAIGSKTEVVDRVYVVLQDLDGNCYQAYEWDVPVEYFANAGN